MRCEATSKQGFPASQIVCVSAEFVFAFAVLCFAHLLICCAVPCRQSQISGPYVPPQIDDVGKCQLEIELTWVGYHWRLWEPRKLYSFDAPGGESEIGGGGAALMRDFEVAFSCSANLTRRGLMSLSPDKAGGMDEPMSAAYPCAPWLAFQIQH